MARYECTQCGVIGENTTCRNCRSTEVRSLDPMPGSVKDVVELTATPAAREPKTPPVPPAAPPAADPPKPKPSRTPPKQEIAASTPPSPPKSSILRFGQRSAAASAVDRTPTPQSKIVNLVTFEQLLDEGMKAVVICGLGQAGKSEIAHGYVRALKMLRGRSMMLTLGNQTGARLNIALGGTAPGSVWFQLMDKRHVFLDPSGEFFTRFSAEYRKSLNLGEITEEYFDFVRKAAQRLAGIVLVLDLTKTTDHTVDDAWLDQESVLEVTLQVLRWLRFDTKVRYQKFDLLTAINLFLETSRKKLDVPVLVLFSKGDRLSEEYDYLNEHPLSFARRRLQTLHAALLTNARRFRFDYVHTMLKDDASGDDLPAKYPCGVLLSMEWLLGGGPFGWMPRLGTGSRFLGGGKQ